MLILFVPHGGPRVALAAGIVGDEGARPVFWELEAVFGGLADAVLRLALLALCAWLLARALHARRVDWRWPALTTMVGLGLCPLGLARPLERVASTAVFGFPGMLCAALLAALMARGWEIDARESGDAMHAGAGGLVTPVHTPGAVFARLVGTRFNARRSASSRALTVGVTVANRRPVSIPARHAIVIGATGSGKTVTLRRLLQESTRTMGAIVIDGKGDPDLERDLERFAGVTGRRFTAWSPHGEVCYDPFAHGGDTEIVDKALAAETWGDDYYLRLGQRFLGFAVRALRTAGLAPTLAALARYVDPDGLEELAPSMEAARPGSWTELAETLPRVGPAERQAIAGTQHRLATIAESDVGCLLAPTTGRERIDLLYTIRNGDVAYFDLNADARPQLSRMVGAAITMDMVSIAATMQRCHEYAPTAVLFDDVQAFATEATMRGLTSLFARGRSAGMMLLLGTQSLSDLEIGARRGTIEQLLDNRATAIVHRLPGFASATRASKELGDRRHPVLTEHLERRFGHWCRRGTATRSEVSSPWVEARDLAGLATGVAVVSTLGRPPCMVRMRLPDQL